MLTILLTSPRVAPGLLSWQAWSVLRSASRVLVGSAGHPLVPALTEAGVVAEVVDVPVAGKAPFLAAAATAADGPVVWLAPPGDGASAELLRALADRTLADRTLADDTLADDTLADDTLTEISDLPVQIVHGSHDLPGAHLLDVVSIMDTLRLSCPWDREQTHSSLLKYLLEETYEAAEAIETADWASLREELGDVLFQAVFHARVASERPAAEGGFTIDDVADVLAAKLTRRHPHVFGSVSVSSAADVNRNWDEIKKAEKAERASAAGNGPASVLDGVAFGQPALSLAAQLQRRAERAGIVTPGFAGAAEVSAAEVGAELMRVVSQARAAGVDPELALREAARTYADQVREAERAHEAEGTYEV